MPTKLGNPYSPLWRGRYPHMLREDYDVWEAFLNAHPNLFLQIYYDVRVGGIWPEDPKLTEKEKQMFYDNTAKRIDALAELKEEVWIIEVASNPGLRALGQLMTYLALWHEDPKIPKQAYAVLVSNTLDTDLKRALELYGMRSYSTVPD
jgi:hypothetical protein